MRYFEDNILSGVDLHDLHDTLHKSAGVVESNILFVLTNEAGDSDEVCLCQSAYNVIAACEAIIDKCNADVADKALANVRDKMEKIQERKDGMSALLAILLGRC